MRSMKDFMMTSRINESTRRTFMAGLLAGPVVLAAPGAFALSESEARRLIDRVWHGSPQSNLRAVSSYFYDLKAIDA